MTTHVMERLHVSDLSKTLVELRKAADMSRRQLEDVSGVSEETIKKIEYGRNVRPTPETLKKIALGLARNRALGRLDQAAADEMLATLMQAAAYIPAPTVDPVPEPISPGIEAELRAMFKPEEAPLVAEILKAWARHDEQRRRFLLSTMKPLVLELPESDR